jgi:hypothetical protein
MLNALQHRVVLLSSSPAVYVNAGLVLRCTEVDPTYQTIVDTGLLVPVAHLNVLLDPFIITIVSELDRVLFPSLRVTDVTCTERQCITIDK